MTILNVVFPETESAGAAGPSRRHAIVTLNREIILAAPLRTAIGTFNGYAS